MCAVFVYIMNSSCKKSAQTSSWQSVVVIFLTIITDWVILHVLGFTHFLKEIVNHLNINKIHNLKTLLNLSISDSLPSMSVIIFVYTAMNMQLNSPIVFTPSLMKQLYRHLSETRVISWRSGIASEGESGSNPTVHTTALWKRIYLSENSPQKCTKIRCLCRSILKANLHKVNDIDAACESTSFRQAAFNFFTPCLVRCCAKFMSFLWNSVLGQNDFLEKRHI